MTIFNPKIIKPDFISLQIQSLILNQPSYLWKLVTCFRLWRFFSSLDPQETFYIPPTHTHTHTHTHAVNDVSHYFAVSQARRGPLQRGRCCSWRWRTGCWTRNTSESGCSDSTCETWCKHTDAYVCWHTQQKQKKHTQQKLFKHFQASDSITLLHPQ